MLELLDEESTTVTPQVSKPVFRQRKTLGKKRQRDDDKNDIEETSGKEPPENMAYDALERKQRKFGTQEATTVQKQVTKDDKSEKSKKIEDGSAKEDEEDEAYKSEKNVQKLKSFAKAPPAS